VNNPLQVFNNDPYIKNGEKVVIVKFILFILQYFLKENLVFFTVFCFRRQFLTSIVGIPKAFDLEVNFFNFLESYC
jgi:hypothetical protein